MLNLSTLNLGTGLLTPDPPTAENLKPYIVSHNMLSDKSPQGSNTTFVKNFSVYVRVCQWLIRHLF